MISDRTLKKWLFAIAAFFFAAGLSGVITAGHHLAGMISVALALLLAAWGVLLHVHSPKRTIRNRLFLATVGLSVVIMGINYVVNTPIISRTLFLSITNTGQWNNLLPYERRTLKRHAFFQVFCFLCASRLKSTFEKDHPYNFVLDISQQSEEVKTFSGHVALYLPRSASVRERDSRWVFHPEDNCPDAVAIWHDVTIEQPNVLVPFKLGMLTLAFDNSTSYLLKYAIVGRSEQEAHPYRSIRPVKGCFSIDLSND